MSYPGYTKVTLNCFSFPSQDGFIYRNNREFSRSGQRQIPMAFFRITLSRKLSDNSGKIMIFLPSGQMLLCHPGKYELHYCTKK